MIRKGIKRKKTTTTVAYTAHQRIDDHEKLTDLRK